ncbi:aliphatic sulfonate ABC transporter substrate-binding protein [Ectobacillus sp. sgz5001026]|uniref:aliphatic sulfonate ABC transporter substrate-binding protein n=1 Tax=Ectobacillus sp. sgz5001026 TaxID=3242473 RepID=UPI0036D350A1
MKKIIAVVLLVFTLLITGCQSNAATAKPKEIRIDYAYYSPLSLVLKDQGFLEKRLAKDGVPVKYVLSQGSNKALEFLNSNSVDFGSAAGGAALIAKAKGAPIESVYVASKPEWTALVTLPDSSVKSVADLKGKKVAATFGTDPHIFLLRALDEAGLSSKDVQLINLQHTDGALALQTKQIDAWAGLDPHMAKVELESKATLFKRQVDWNTYSLLHVRSEFAKQYPAYVKVVLEAYEDARKWALAHPEETAQILAKEAKLDPEIAKLELKRSDFSNAIPNDAVKDSLKGASTVLLKEKIIPPNTDTKKTIDELIQPSFAKEVVK